jgi:hypothetical protein
MFTTRFFIATLFLFSLLSCSKKDSQPEPITNLLSGSWNVAGYIYNDQDRTESLSGYTFTFTPDKKITAVKQDTLITGTWHSDYIPGDPPMGAELYIEFKFSSHVPAFVDISKRWKPYVTGNDVTLLGFYSAIGLTLARR